MNYVNLTPHKIEIYRQFLDGDAKPTGEHEHVLSVPASGAVARVLVNPVYCWTDTTTNVEMFRQVTGEVVDLPDRERGTFLIVSAMVRTALSGRPDLASPGELLRNDEGQPIGCIGLYINEQEGA